MMKLDRKIRFFFFYVSFNLNVQPTKCLSKTIMAPKIAGEPCLKPKKKILFNDPVVFHPCC